MSMIYKILYYNKLMLTISKKEKKNGINTAQKRIQKKNQKIVHTKKYMRNLKKDVKISKNKMKNYKILVQIKKNQMVFNHGMYSKVLYHQNKIQMIMNDFENYLNFFCQTKISILTIDIGFKHTSICEWNPNNKKYKIYLFSVDSD